jgi:hypothetical protein
MRKTRLKVALAICMMVVASAAAYAAVINRITVNNTVNVLAAGIGVYKDNACAQPLSTIDWGDIPRGRMKDFIFYVRAESGSDGTGINAFWDPRAPSADRLNYVLARAHCAVDTITS